MVTAAKQLSSHKNQVNGNIFEKNISLQSAVTRNAVDYKIDSSIINA